MLPQGLLPARPQAMHKGKAGRVFLLAGSEGLSGAAALCARAALRTGAGLVTVGVPKRLHDAMVQKLTEAMFKLLPETAQGSLSLQALPEILQFSKQSDVAAIGPGLSQHPETQQLIRAVVAAVDKPLVIDADGLNAFAGKPAELRKLASAVVITPHPGEMARLCAVSVEAVESDRQAIALQFAREHQLVVVLKGHESVVAAPDGNCYRNTTGNPGMATGGCGDVLTGMIAALIGQGLSVYDAARLGVYLHGLSGDLVAKVRGEIGLIAGDLIDTIPLAIQQYQQS